MVAINGQSGYALVTNNLKLGGAGQYRQGRKLLSPFGMTDRPGIGSVKNLGRYAASWISC